MYMYWWTPVENQYIWHHLSTTCGLNFHLKNSLHSKPFFWSLPPPHSTPKSSKVHCIHCVRMWGWWRWQWCRCEGGEGGVSGEHGRGGELTWHLLPSLETLVSGRGVLKVTGGQLLWLLEGGAMDSPTSLQQEGGRRGGGRITWLLQTGAHFLDAPTSPAFAIIIPLHAAQVKTTRI